MKFQLALFACLAAMIGVQAAPVPGLLGNLLQPLQGQGASTSTVRPIASAIASVLPISPSGGLLESNTGTTVASILKQYKIIVPENLNSSLDSIKISSLDEIRLSQFLRFLLGNDGIHIPTGSNIESLIKQITNQFKNGLHPTYTDQGSNGNGYKDFLNNFLISYKNNHSGKDGLFGDVFDIFTDGVYTSSKTPQSTAKTGNLPEINLGPLANVKPSASIAVLPTANNKGVLGLVNVDVSAALNVEGAKITLAPKIHA